MIINKVFAMIFNVVFEEHSIGFFKNSTFTFIGN